MTTTVAVIRLISGTDLWQNVPLAPPDSIFKLTAAYKADAFENKVNLGVGAYRDDNNKPWVLPVVRKAEQIILDTPALDHEYLPITGLPEFTSAAAKLILGPDSRIITQARVTSVQTISGTGANHLGALFLSRFYRWTGNKEIYLSDPTWANHQAIFKNVGVTPVNYPYYDPRTIGLDFDGFLSSLKFAPAGSVFLLHACAHNPTGVDPTRDQWNVIADIILEKGHYAFFDCAYQGFASGDLDNDAWAIRFFVDKGVNMLVCGSSVFIKARRMQSFAKNAGLYGERVGALHVVSPSREAAERVKSQLSVLQRSEISNPPTYGARIVTLILNDAALFEEWKRDIKTMAGRIIDMRKLLHKLLTEELHTPGNWDHIVNQIGMFSFTGITPEQSKILTDKYHIYLTVNGRISMCGLNTNTLRYFAESLDKVSYLLRHSVGTCENDVITGQKTVGAKNDSSVPVVPHPWKPKKVLRSSSSTVSIFSRFPPRFLMGTAVSSAGSSATSSDELSSVPHASPDPAMASTLVPRPTHIAMPPSPFANISISVTPSPSSRLENPFESPLISPAIFYTAPSTPIAESPASQNPPRVPGQLPTSPSLTSVMHMAIPHVLPPASSPSSFAFHTPPNLYPPASYTSPNSATVLPQDHVSLLSTSTTDDSFPESSDFPEDSPLDDEGLSTLEKIYLYSRSKSSFHRVFIANALPELLEQVTPHEAIAYVLPLLNTLAMDDDEMVKEAFSSKLVTIIWWFFAHCQLIPVDVVDEDSVNPPEFQDYESPPTISVQAFTPILGTLLLSPNVFVGGATRYAVVALLGRITRVNAMQSQSGANPLIVHVQEHYNAHYHTNSPIPENDDEEDVVIGLFGKDERALFQREILFQVIIGMGRLDSAEGEDRSVEEQPSNRTNRIEQEPRIEIVQEEEGAVLQHPKQDFQIVSPQREAPNAEYLPPRQDTKKFSQTHNPYFPPISLASHLVPTSTSNESPVSSSSSGSSSSGTTGSMTGPSEDDYPSNIPQLPPSPSYFSPSVSSHSPPASAIPAWDRELRSALVARPSPPMFPSRQSDVHAFSNVSEVSEGNWPTSPSRSHQQDASAYGALSSNIKETQTSSPSSDTVDMPSYESIEMDDEGDCDEAAIGRLSSMSLVAAVAASGYLDNDSANAFVTEVERVSHDSLYWVRREACFALGALAKAVPAEVVQLTLMRTLQYLVSDPAHHVRHSSLFALPTILSRLPFSERRQKALEIMIPMSMDVSPDVRAGVLEALGEVIYTFHEEDKIKPTYDSSAQAMKASETPPEELLKMFLGRTQDRRIIDGQQPHVFEEERNKPLIMDKREALEAFYQDPSRPLICAFNFPAVTLTVGRSRWHSTLRDTYLWLAGSNTPGVKRTLAASLGEMAKILGAENAQKDLLGVWHNAFLASEDDVRLKLIESLVPFVVALPQEGQVEILSAVLNVWSSGGFMSWREREGVAKSLNELLKIEGPDIAGIVWRLMMHALADSVNTVREAVIFMASSLRLSTSFLNSNDSILLAPQLLDDVEGQGPPGAHTHRLHVYGTFRVVAKKNDSLLFPGPEGGDPSMEIDAELCSTIASLASDAVVGVRIGVARLISSICAQQRKEDKPIPALLLGVVPVLSQDSSNEVRSYAANCLEKHAKDQELENMTAKFARTALTFSRPPPPVWSPA
ncbi:hypothetical protein D9757_001993 [Collybiopsis confluens]|uniref:Aspartate aminotransferase n=1 Tax=Collybiopsis confluens TaxID=2823264 RepID=A0A8H5HXF6_9AGAR|nr:hypothetical protein D9757_001993 [Collybiopsis confluens]